MSKFYWTKILRMETQKTLLQKTYEINVGQDSLDIDFLEARRQFDWMEISLVSDKSEKHTTIYHSCNVEMASKRIKSARLTNFTEIYSLTNEKNTISTTCLKNIYFTSNLWHGAVMDQVSLPSVIICIILCIKNQFLRMIILM